MSSGYSKLLWPPGKNLNYIMLFRRVMVSLVTAVAVGAVAADNETDSVVSDAIYNL